jgi:hypothetical protein
MTPSRVEVQRTIPNEENALNNDDDDDDDNCDDSE